MDHTLLIIIPIILIQLHVYITIYIYIYIYYFLFFFSISISLTEYVMEYLTQKGVSPISEEPLNFIVQHKCVKPLKGNSIRVISLLLCMSHLESFTAIIAHNAKHEHFEIWIASLRLIVDFIRWSDKIFYL